MKLYGRSSVSEYLGDMIVYRNLEPVDPRLPSLAALRRDLGLPDGPIPRKQEAEYARVVVELLRRARALDAPRARLARLLYLGDTRLSDGGAFANLCQAGGWSGRAFIASETTEPVKMEVASLGDGATLALANRWAALEAFDRSLAENGFQVDEATAVIIDLDKTAIGARGRNAPTIDAARVQAVHETVAGLLGNSFDPQAFGESYNRLILPEFHPFTTDNQDYVAYLCLVLGSGLYRWAELEAGIHTGRLASFRQFIEQIDARKRELPEGLRTIHDEIYAYVLAGDPTPFKAFRRSEYRITLARMGCLPDTAPIGEILTSEIVLTQEVRRAALEWHQRGALIFGLSDKPDEASLPDPVKAAPGDVALHRKETHVVGE